MLETKETTQEGTLFNINNCASIAIAPQADVAVQALYNESLALRSIALNRVIANNEDLKPATEDLSLIAKLKKAIEEKRKAYVNPIREHLDNVNTAFKELTAPLELADKVTREKILAFHAEQEHKRREAEAIEREKEELARREAALNGGEITVDTTPVEKPEAAPDKVRTDMGMASVRSNWKARVIDFKVLPDEYKLPDMATLNAKAKSSKGTAVISGVEFYNDQILAINTK